MTTKTSDEKSRIYRGVNEVTSHLRSKTSLCNFIRYARTEAKR